MDDLKLIKKKYGEEMMHLCRKLFPTILEEEGKLISILDSTFGHPKYLYDDIKNDTKKFKDFIYYIYGSTTEKKVIDKTPFELLDEAGYTLYECKCESDISEFKKYYRKDEELCTFNDDRLKTNYVFFALKKNVDEIKRENFNDPKREDEYGTSVISIQFTRGRVNTLSIKNRYNHTVINPDCTFNNDLEKIIPGLTYSFEKYYNLNINQNYPVELSTNYVRANDGKYYKYNMEIGNIYYCPENTIIRNGEVIKKFMDKEKYIVMDYFILNLQNKEENNINPKSVSLYSKIIKDSFVDDLKDLKKINITKVNKNEKIIELIKNNDDIVYIKLNKFNNIVSYKNLGLNIIKDNFLKYNSKLESIIIDNVTKIGDNFLSSNRIIKNIDVKNVLKIGDNFLDHCSSLRSINLESVKEIDNDFLKMSEYLEYINAPNLISVKDNFLQLNWKMKTLVLPSLISAGDSFLAFNTNLELLSIPNLESTGVHFLYSNQNVKSINFNKLKELKAGFFKSNSSLKKINLDSVVKIAGLCLRNANIEDVILDNVEEIGYAFMENNKLAKNVSMKKLVKVNDNFFRENWGVENIYFPNLQKIGSNFFEKNNDVKSVSLPKCISVSNKFLFLADEIEEVIMPNLIFAGSNFMYRGESVKKIYMPLLEDVGANFLYWNIMLEEINLPSLYAMGAYFLNNNNRLKKIYMPSLSTDFATLAFCAKIKNMKNEGCKVYLKDWKC